MLHRASEWVLGEQGPPWRYAVVDLYDGHFVYETDSETAAEAFIIGKQDPQGFVLLDTLEPPCGDVAGP